MELEKPMGKQPSRINGYTLLEILVVLVMISIVASMAMLTIGHNERKRLEVFTQKLAQTLSLAEEQALLQPATLGLGLSPDSFRFYEYRKTQTEAHWEALSDQELGLQTIPADIQISLKIEDKIQALQTEDNKTPAILISTNGTLTPFVILIGKKNEKPRYVLRGHANGSISSNVYKG
jgi:general secretion pathway protein H